MKMAGKKNHTFKTNYGENGTGQFADVKLNANDRQAFDEWYKDHFPDAMEAIGILCRASYRVTFKDDLDKDCVVVTLTQQDAKHHNANLVIMSRSDNEDEALAIAFYKVFVLFDGVRLPTSQQADTWG
jgi:hypothetical protein